MEKVTDVPQDAVDPSKGSRHLWKRSSHPWKRSRTFPKTPWTLRKGHGTSGKGRRTLRKGRRPSPKRLRVFERVTAPLEKVVAPSEKVGGLHQNAFDPSKGSRHLWKRSSHPWKSSAAFTKTPSTLRTGGATFSKGAVTPKKGRRLFTKRRRPAGKRRRYLGEGASLDLKATQISRPENWETFDQMQVCSETPPRIVRSGQTNPPLMQRLAFLLLAFGTLFCVPVVQAQEMSKLEAAAEQGDVVAQYNVGVRLANGRGVPKDEAQAVRWYQMAADQSDQPQRGGSGSRRERLLPRKREQVRVPVHVVTCHRNGFRSPRVSRFPNRLRRGDGARRTIGPASSGLYSRSAHFQPENGERHSALPSDGSL